MNNQNSRQVFTVEYVILPKVLYWRELKRGQKFALSLYGFSENNERFEIYTKRTWGRAFLETHPNKPDYPIYKLINPLKSPVYLVAENYYFNY